MIEAVDEDIAALSLPLWVELGLRPLLGFGFRSFLQIMLHVCTEPGPRKLESYYIDPVFLLCYWLVCADQLIIPAPCSKYRPPLLVIETLEKDISPIELLVVATQWA